MPPPSSQHLPSTPLGCLLGSIPYPAHCVVSSRHLRLPQRTDIDSSIDSRIFFCPEDEQHVKSGNTITRASSERTSRSLFASKTSLRPRVIQQKSTKTGQKQPSREETEIRGHSNFQGHISPSNVLEKNTGIPCVVCEYRAPFPITPHTLYNPQTMGITSTDPQPRERTNQSGDQRPMEIIGIHLSFLLLLLLMLLLHIQNKTNPYTK